MKHHVKALLGPALAAALLVGWLAPAALAADSAAAKPAKVADLQVQIDVPPSWRPFLDDDIADALARVLRENFRRRGYAGEIDYLSDRERRAPNPDLPLLVVRLHEWRITRTGHAECAFTSTLRAGAHETDLGLISNTALTWIRERNRFGLAAAHDAAHAYEDAAGGAMRDLYRRVAETGRVPGLELKKK